MKKRYLVVGCGLYGAVFARKLAESGYHVVIIDKRNHIGGNCYTEKKDNILVHKYGPHAFHTNSDAVWSFVNRFSKFNDFRLRIKVEYKNKIYSFPINLFTLNQLYGVTTADSAMKFMSGLKKQSCGNNFESYILGNLGDEIYEIFYYGYTRKQWDLEPSKLSDTVAKRVAIRYDFNDDYFNDKYQGIPINGYTQMFENLLDHENIKIELNCDFFEDRNNFENDFNKIIYSGKIDQLFEYKYGLLGYRSLRFEEQTHETTYQGNSIINFTDYAVPYTRIVEHKYFAQLQQDKTIITIEYPEKYDEYKIPFYPIPTQENHETYAKYQKDMENLNKYIIGGRLGKYLYLNMDQVIGMALKNSEDEIVRQQSN